MANRLFVMVLLFATFIVGIERLVVRVLQSSTQSPDPFTQYRAFLPGQDVQALPLLPCQDNTQNLTTQLFPLGDYSQLTTSCTLRPPDGAFEQINLNIQSGTVVEAAYYSSQLQLGDLLLQWGRPTTMQRSGANRDFELQWDTSLYTVNTTVRHYRPETPVRVVTLTNQHDEIETPRSS